VFGIAAIFVSIANGRLGMSWFEIDEPDD